ncbi:putative damage-inducible protein DinB [Melghirimyces profundicolus]|uniref:Putative damage-inducible protein DinB n=1 Tax=Melghirimyces profundicolus TaxID=1242148 RepID=A0A2T6BXN5_9BACL|nr:DinB family protein [Melghirimyces profundicolus]PTX60828.1 putative damage-inducible protein DinB [Melghirimyces profundicolus]
MPEVSVVRDLLLEELQTGVRTTKKLLDRVEPEQWSYRPKENMSSLLELARHLAQIPLVDLAILRERNEQEVKALEKETSFDTSEELGSLMDRGFRELNDYMKALSREDFLHKRTRPFYADHALPQAQWLTEIVTHVFHHRAQLFNYLKQLGHPVNMFDLY